MGNRLLAACAVLAVTLAASAGPKPAGDREKLQGSWTLVRVVHDGKKVTDTKSIGSRVLIKGDRITATDEDNKEVYVVTYTLNPRASPKAIDMKIVSGKEKERGKTAEGIYDLKGATLRVCYSYAPGKRPKDFTTKPGDKQILLEMKRSKR